MPSSVGVMLMKGLSKRESNIVVVILLGLCYMLLVLSFFGVSCPFSESVAVALTDRPSASSVGESTQILHPF